MPIYAYKCQACEHEFEKLQRISDVCLTVCPYCNEPELKKMLTAAAFHLKGTGWYETDFKNTKPAQDQSEKAKNPIDKSTPTIDKEAPKTETPGKSSKSNSNDAS